MGNGAGRGTRFSEHGTQANMHDNIRRSLESLEEEIPKLVKETSENKEWAIKSMRDIETNIKEYINGVTSYLAKEVHLSEIKRNSEDLRTSGKLKILNTQYLWRFNGEGCNHLLRHGSLVYKIPSKGQVAHFFRSVVELHKNPSAKETLIKLTL